MILDLQMCLAQCIVSNIFKRCWHGKAHKKISWKQMNISSNIWIKVIVSFVFDNSSSNDFQISLDLLANV